MSPIVNFLLVKIIIPANMFPSISLMAKPIPNVSQVIKNQILIPIIWKNIITAKVIIPRYVASPIRSASLSL